MGSASVSDTTQKELEPDLAETGNCLLAIPSSTNELLILLEKVESLLSRVWQQPPKSTCTALLPIMKALITNDILRHSDLEIQVTVASCFNELSRITAPDPPYSDGVMRVFFRLFMIAFKQLPSETGLRYARSLQILETVAKVKSSLVLLDIDTDGLIVEMFELFLKGIRSSHPSEVFEYMEAIMTLVLEESEKIPVELLRPLLASVKMDNKRTSSIQWELGNKVLENCATKLHCDLKEAVKAMNLNLSDYAEIVTSICQDTSENSMESKEGSPSGGNEELSQLDGGSKAVHDESTPRMKNGNTTNSDDKSSLKINEPVEPAEDSRSFVRKRSRKFNSLIRPDEGYPEVLSDGYNKEKKEFSKLGNSSVSGDSSKKINDSVNEVNPNKRAQLKKKETSSDQNNDLELSSGLKRRILQKKVKERGLDGPKKTGTRAIPGSGNKILSDTDTEESYGKKKVEKDKMEQFPIIKSVKTKNLKKESEKKLRKPQVDNGEGLVNLRIQVWWPKDKTFYPGIVNAFDPVTKKHTILYDDYEIEVLNLRKERWELIDNEQPPQKQEADHHPTPAKEPVMNLISSQEKEKTGKRKIVPSKKYHASSSSKRSKGENSSREISPPNFICATGASKDEIIRGTNISLDDDGENREGKEDSDINKD